MQSRVFQWRARIIAHVMRLLWPAVAVRSRTTTKPYMKLYIVVVPGNVDYNAQRKFAPAI